MFLPNLFLVYLSILSLITLAAVTSDQPKHRHLNYQLRNKLNALRDKGHLFHSSGRFRDASKCYSAALQLVEGVPGDEAYELRRRCGLNLAYCNLKDDLYPTAVARCSEVIDESSNYFNEHGETPGLSARDAEMLRQALATAHRRRHQALKYLKKDDLAEIDLALSKFYKVNTSTHQRSKVLKKYPEQYNALQEFVEECQSLYPRDFLTKKEVISLTSSSDNSKLGFLQSSPENTPFGNDPGIGSLLGGFGKDLKLSGIIRQFGPILGLSNNFISVIVSVLEVYDKIARVTYRISTVVKNNKELISAALTTMWVLYFFHEQLLMFFQITAHSLITKLTTRLKYL